MGAVSISMTRPRDDARSPLNNSIRDTVGLRYGSSADLILFVTGIRPDCSGI